MNTRLSLISASLIIGSLLSACGPSQAEQEATVTRVAANVFATQTAQVPIITPTFTPSPTPTPTPTATPTLTPTLSRARAEAVLHEFMTLMSNKDPQKASGLLSKRAKGSIGSDALQKLLQGGYYALFEGYQTVRVNTIYGRPTFTTDPSLDQGDITTVRGNTYYEGDFVGTIDATFELDGDEWWLTGVYVIVPPSKF